MKAFLQKIPSRLRIRGRHFHPHNSCLEPPSWLVGAGQAALAGQSSRADQGWPVIGEAARCRAPDWGAAAAAINKSAKHATKLRRCLFMGTSLFSFVRLRRFTVMVRSLPGTSAWTGNTNPGSERENLRLTKVLARAETTLASAASGLNASPSK